MSVRIFLFFILCFNGIHAQMIIMIDPAGDAKHTGRVINGTFERTITLEMAQELKAALMFHMPCSVTITRSTGELIAPLQNAQFANRLAIDLYLNLNCSTTSGPVSIYVYQFSYGESFITSQPSLSFIPCETAHHAAFRSTGFIAKQIVESMQRSHSSQFQTYGPFCIPIVPLKGIKAPALSIEMLLTSQHDWRSLVAPIAQAIKHALSL